MTGAIKIVFVCIALVANIIGVWWIPWTREEATDPRAPYRCVRGVLMLLGGFILLVSAL